MTKTVAVIGGGPAGMEATAELLAHGYAVSLLEEKEKTGGHLNDWDRLFPSKRKSSEVLDYLNKGLDPQVEILYQVNIKDIAKQGSLFRISIEGRPDKTVDAILISTGFTVFDATRKEEYGYGIYDNVITSVDLERMFRENNEIRTAAGKIPDKIGIIHCVGSRDEKVGNMHCSKVCCVTGVKQAIELKEILPQSTVFCFYMDLRMFGMGYEELYKQSQEEFGVQFIRGRLSEAFENPDGSLVIKVEDTLTAKPLRMNVDLLVLLVGFLPSAGTSRIGKMLELNYNQNGFLKAVDEHTLIHDTGVSGVFLAGSCKGPKNIEETLADARSAVSRIDHYLKSV
ncbi:MAG: FAD-dependent oxidoreductase [Bacteroidales bacterium]